MQSKKCTKLDECSAPLCPLNQKSLEGIWYPDEEICSTHSYAWIKRQQKIAKKARDPDRAFTLEMLRHECVIRPGISGVSPDRTHEGMKEAVKDWLDAHPVAGKRELTAEQRIAARERLAKARKLLSCAKKTASAIDQDDGTSEKGVCVGSEA